MKGLPFSAQNAGYGLKTSQTAVLKKRQNYVSVGSLSRMTSIVAIVDL